MVGTPVRDASSGLAREFRRGVVVAPARLTPPSARGAVDVITRPPIAEVSRAQDLVRRRGRAVRAHTPSPGRRHEHERNRRRRSSPPPRDRVRRRPPAQRLRQTRLSDARLPVLSEAFPDAYAASCDDISRRGREHGAGECRRAAHDAQTAHLAVFGQPGPPIIED